MVLSGVLNRFKKIKQIFVFLLVVGLMFGGGVTLFEQYPQIFEQVEKNRPSYFEEYYFIDRLIASSSFLAYETNEKPTEEMDSLELTYWESELNRFPNELDYYMTNQEQSIEVGRKDKLLKQLIGNKKPNWEVLKDNYQFVIEFSVDQKGILSVEEVYGADKNTVEQLLRASLPNYIYHQPNLLNGMTFIYGVPLELPENGRIVSEMSFYDDEYYVWMTLPYSIGMLLVVCLIIFIIPFKWVKQFKVVQMILATPLELSPLFFGGTVLVAMGLPLLIIATHSGGVLELIEWFINTNQGPYYVSLINVLAWTLFIAIISIDAIYIKQCFVVGFKAMIVEHSLFGRMVRWMMTKFKKIKKDPTINHQPAQSNLPIFEVLTHRLSELSKTLETLNQADEELNMIKQEISLIIQLVESQQEQISIDVLSLIQEIVNHIPSFSEKLELKIQESNSSTTVSVHQHQFSFMLDELFNFISQYAIQNSRVHVSFKESENLNEMSIGFVVTENEDELEKIRTFVQQMIENQGGIFKFSQDGDFVKFSFKLNTPQENH